MVFSEDTTMTIPYLKHEGETRNLEELIVFFHLIYQWTIMLFTLMILCTLIINFIYYDKLFSLRIRLDKQFPPTHTGIYV